MAAITICSHFGAPKHKVCHSFHCFPIYLTWSYGTGCHDLSFWMLSFKPTFSLSSFTFNKRLFSSLLSAMVSSVYLRLWIFLPAIFIPVYASFSPAITNASKFFIWFCFVFFFKKKPRTITMNKTLLITNANTNQSYKRNSPLFHRSLLMTRTDTSGITSDVLY